MALCLAVPWSGDIGDYGEDCAVLALPADEAADVLLPVTERWKHQKTEEQSEDGLCSHLVHVATLVGASGKTGHKTWGM